MKNKAFFIVQNNTEFFAALYFKKIFINDYNCIAICFESFRIKKEDLDNCFSEIIYFPSIPYTKNIFKVFKQSKQLKKELLKINIDSSDILITPQLHDIGNIIVLDFFSKTNSKIITYSFDGQDIQNEHSTLKIKESLEYSLCTLIAVNKITKIITFKNSIFYSPYLNYTTDLLIDFGASNLKNSYNHKFYFKFKAFYPLNRDQYNREEIILFICTPKTLLITGLQLEEYLSKTREIIFYIKSNNCKIKVKDHPTASIKDHELIKLLNIKIDELIPNNFFSEKYLMENHSKIKLILSGPSNLLLTSILIGIKSYNIDKLFSDFENQFKEVFNYRSINKISEIFSETESVQKLTDEECLIPSKKKIQRALSILKKKR